ncbi:RDD family protein [Nocardiopsis coralliicola]
MTQPPPSSNPYHSRPQQEPGPFPRAGWGARIGARAIDAAAAAIPVFLIGAVGGLLAAGAAGLGGSNSMDQAFTIVTAVVAYLACVVYESAMVVRRRATFGKQVLNLQIAPAAGGGRQGPIPVMATAARAALLWLPVVFAFSAPLFVSACAVAFAVFGVSSRLGGPERRGIHDKVAGTAVLTDQAA